MARILIRNSDRRILFYTHDSTFSDIDNGVNAIQAKHPGDTTFLTKSTNVPANIRVGWYINSTLDAVSAEPFGDLLVAQQRRAQMESKLDEHQDMIRSGAMLGVPAGVAERWYRYLRMMTQASMRDDVLADAAQWALVETSLDVDPYDIEMLTTAETALFDSTFAGDGEFALGWFDLDTRTQPKRTDAPSDPRLSGTTYDLRFASQVRLIPEIEIDRTNTLLLQGSQPWFGRADVIDVVNRRFPWYANNHDSLLSLSRFSPRMFANFLPTVYERSGNFSSSISSAVLTVHTRSHSATTVITAGALRSTNGSLNVPFTLGQVIDFVVVVTAGDGVHTSTYTYTITRRASG